MGNLTKVNPSAQTGPLNRPPVMPQTKPATTAPTTVTPSVPGPVAPQIKDNTQVSAQGTALGSVSFFDAPPPPPPALLKVGDSSATVTELNKLLKDIGLLQASTHVYTTDTETAVKSFQKDNHLPVTGSVDALTLRKLIEATKEDETNYPKLETLLGNTPTGQGEKPSGGGEPVTDQPVEPKQYATEYDRVKDLVATQLSDKGSDPEKAFAVGSSLKDAASKWDRKMPSSSLCYTAVKRAIDDALHVPYQVFGGKGHPNGSWAKTAGKYLLSQNPEFVKIEGLKRADLDNLPAGAVIVYKPAKGPGHIGVQDGQGHDISDKTRTQANVYRSADFEVYYPVAVREKP
ncbi:MAG: peptidoglycan-binding protein [Candidatus Sericytochromatia bacterium]